MLKAIRNWASSARKAIQFAEYQLTSADTWRRTTKTAFAAANAALVVPVTNLYSVDAWKGVAFTVATAVGTAVLNGVLIPIWEQTKARLPKP